MSYRLCVLHKTFLIVIFLSVALFSQSALAQQNVVVLKIIINNMDLGEDFVVMADKGDVWVSREFLKKTLLKEGLGKSVQHSGESYLSLKSVRKLKFSIDEKALSLKIVVPAALFKKNTIDVTHLKKAKKVIYSSKDSAFFNYGLNYEAKNSIIDLSTEFGVKRRDYLGVTNFNYRRIQGDGSFVRLFTSVTKDDRKKLTRLTYGDFSTPSELLGSSHFLGGVNFSKNYQADPYFLRYPSFSISGAVTTPSDVDIYSHGVLIRRLELPPGEFTLDNIPLSTGLGDTEVMITDAFHNEQIFKESAYFSNRLLKSGLHEYNYAIGLTREDIGLKSFSYSKLVLQAVHRLGFEDDFKGGFFFEASNDVITAGPTATIGIAGVGIVETALAVSRAEGLPGYAGSMQYSFTSKHFSSSLSLKTLSRDYSNISLKPSADRAFFEFSGSLGFNKDKLGSLFVNLSTSRMYDGADRSYFSITHSRPVTRRASLLVIASSRQEEGVEDINEIHLILNVNLGWNVHGNVNYKGSSAGNVTNASVRRDLPVGTGFGFIGELTELEGRVDKVAGASYQNDYGIYGVKYTERSGSDSYNLSMAGGVGYIDGSVFISRPLTDSFTKVNVGDLEGVRIYHYGHEVGETDKKGNLIIPQVRSYHDNRVELEKSDIPLNYNVTKLVQYINPPPRSGSLLYFEAGKVQALMGRVYTFVNGEKVPIATSPFTVTLKDGSVIEGLVGYDGEFYVENVPSGKFIVKVIHEGAERFGVIEVPRSDSMWVELSEVIVAESAELKEAEELLRKPVEPALPEVTGTEEPVVKPDNIALPGVEGTEEPVLESIEPVSPELEEAEEPVVKPDNAALPVVEGTEEPLIKPGEPVSPEFEEAE